jgi:hypothetical protein
MCILLVDLFCYKCGHTEAFQVPSANMSCQMMVRVMALDLDEKCSHCQSHEAGQAKLWSHGIWIERERKRIYCHDGFASGEITFRYRLDDVAKQPYESTPQALWERRKDFLRRYGEYLNYCRSRELLAKLPIIHESLIDTSESRCAICYGDFKTFGELKCEGGGAMRLPCGHLFGNQCFLSHVFNVWDHAYRSVGRYQEKPNLLCPLCRKSIFGEDSEKMVIYGVGCALRKRILEKLTGETWFSKKYEEKSHRLKAVFFILLWACTFDPISNFRLIDFGMLVLLKIGFEALFMMVLSLWKNYC